MIVASAADGITVNILKELNALASGRRAQQAGQALKLMAGAAGLVCVLGHLAGSPRVDYNGARLAPTFSLLLGHPPYYPMDHGPILSTMYGPITYFFYLPCGIFYQHVTLAIMSGSLLSLAAFVLPVALILWRRRERLGRARMIWLAT